MSPSNQKNLMIAMFATPVILCFIGMGALLNILVSLMHEEQLATAEVSTKCQDAIAENQKLRDALAEQEERAKKAQAQIDAENSVIGEDQANAGAADAKETEIDGLERRIAVGDGKLSKEKQRVEQLPWIRQKNAELNISLEDLKKKLQENKDEIKRLTDACDLARKAKDKERRRVDVTTLDGTRKIGRHKPVFVECSGNQAILQPQERMLSADPGAADRETLLAAAQTTRYVVFLIRPDGFQCFENYRALVISAGQSTGTPIEFGYEPVNADWELLFPGKEG